MIKKFIFILFVLTGLTIWGQNPDTCQCRLMYGNALHSTLVTYHHDSVVSYRNSIFPKDTLFKMLAKKNRTNSVLRPEYYEWHKFTIDYFYNDKAIGKMLKGQFYPMYYFDIIPIKSQYNSYYLEFNKAYNDSFLYKEEFEIGSYQKIDGKDCNCYTSDRFRFKGNFRDINLTRDNLNTVSNLDEHSSDTTNVFVWDDACTMGVFKYCYFKGVGFVSVDYPYPDDLIFKIKYLHPNCNTFFKTKFGIDIIDK